MNNTYQLILKNGSVEDVMRQAVKAEESQLQAAIHSLKGNEVIQIGSWTFENLRLRGVHAVLDRGCLLYLYHLVSDEHESRELFYGLIKEMGVSRTQAYREIQVWKRFSNELIEKPELVSCFVPEALKILAQDSTPESARVSAIKHAQQGQGVDIRQAHQLIRVHRSGDMGDSPVDENQKPAQAKNPARRPVTQAKGFIRRVIKLVHHSKRPLLPNDLDAIIQELEKAIKQIRTTEASKAASR